LCHWILLRMQIDHSSPFFFKKTPCDTVSDKWNFFQQPLTQKFCFLFVNDFKFSQFMQSIIIDSFCNDVAVAYVYDESGISKLTQPFLTVTLSLLSTSFHSRCILMRKELKMKWNRKIAKCLRNNFLHIHFVGFLEILYCTGLGGIYKLCDWWSKTSWK
jgi:hypothetical protein